ncbi:MAG: hypothetical protein JWM65_53 [Sphingomonas bacterium]|nr:hypothetical protein [Sphingomonas bacterium]
MPHTGPRPVRRARRVRESSLLTRLCIGILGLFPMVTAALMPLVHNLTVAAVMAGVGAVTFMSLLPRGDRRRS